MPVNELIANPAGLNLPGAFGSAMKLAEMKSQYDYEPRKRQLGEELTLAQIRHLQQEKTKSAAEKQHNEAVGLAQGVLSADDKQGAYKQMKQLAIEWGHQNANQLPDELTPDILNRLRVLGYSKETGNQFVINKQAQDSADKVNGPTAFPTARASPGVPLSAIGAPVDAVEIKAPTPLQEQTPSGVPSLPPVGMSGPGAMSTPPDIVMPLSALQQAGQAQAPIAASPAPAVPAATPAPQPPMNERDKLLAKADEADARAAKRLTGRVTTNDQNMAKQDNADAAKYRSEADKMRGLDLREQSIDDVMTRWNQKREDAKAKMAGGELSPGAIKIAAYEQLFFGKQIRGLGLMGQQQRALIQNERSDLATKLGLSQDEAAMLPSNNTVKMKAVDKLTTWGAFVDKGSTQLDKTIDIAIGYAEQLGPDKMRIVNKAILAGKKEFNDPIANAYALQVNTVRTEYMRLMTGPTSNAMLPVEAIKKGDELISAAQDLPSWREIKKAILMDAKATRDSITVTNNNLLESIKSGGKTEIFGSDESAPKTDKSAPKTGTVVEKDGVKWKFRGGFPGDKNNWERQ